MSWSTQLFFQINQAIGTHKILDRCMRFCAHDLLYLHAFASLLWATTGLFAESSVSVNTYLKLLMTAGVFGFGTNYLVAFLAPHVRPIREFPRQVKQLIEPLGTWKSFPSDHTAAAFIVFYVTALMGAPLIVTIPLCLSAMLVSAARVYVGVHYPRDIVGGFIVATAVCGASFWLLANVAQPMYDVLTYFFL